MRGCADRGCTQCKHVYRCLFSRTGVELLLNISTTSCIPDIIISGYEPGLAIHRIYLLLYLLRSHNVLPRIRTTKKIKKTCSNVFPRSYKKKVDTSTVTSTITISSAISSKITSTIKIMITIANPEVSISCNSYHKRDDFEVG